METKEINYLIRQATIDKTTAALSEIIYKLGENPRLTTAQLTEITKRHKTSSDIMTYGVKVGVFERIPNKKGFYRALVLRAEPIHARKILEYRAEVWRKSMAEAKKKENSFGGKIRRFFRNLFGGKK